MMTPEEVDAYVEAVKAERAERKRLHLKRKNRDYYLRNREQRCAYERRRRQQNPAQFREYELRRRYGISSAEFESLFAQQEHRCAICRSKDPFGQFWAVDHSHADDRVRAILCNKCNPMIGFAREDTEVLRAAIEYLEKHRLPRR
jgi:hypothetical protein